MRLPDRYSMVMPIAAWSEVDPRWWTAFQDPVLDALIAQGLAESVTLAEARERLREAEALARRAAWPIDGNGRLEATSGSARGENGEAGLNAEFLPPTGLSSRIAGSQARLEAAGYDEIEVRRVVLSELGLAYVDLRYFQQLLVYRQQDLASRRKTLEEVTKQVDAGAATQFDLKRAELLVVETRTLIPQLEASIVQQRNRLSTLVGRPVGDLGINLGFVGRQPRPKGKPAVGVPADLLRARPDVRRAERLYAAAISDISEAEAARYPRLTLSGLIAAPLTSGSSESVLGAGLVIPIFNQGSLAADVSAAEARANQALLQWRGAVLIAVEEVENALASLQGSQRAAGAARELVTLNEETLLLSRQLLEISGDTTVLDVLDRERALSEARVGLAANLRAVATDYILLRTALGLDDGMGQIEVVAKIE